MTEDPDAELQARLKKLSSGIAAQKEEMKTGSAKVTAPVKADGIGAAYSLAMRVMAEFVAGVIVGALLGWQLDKWLNTSPWLLIVFLLLGTVAGFWNVYRIAAAPTHSKAPPTRADMLDDDDK